MAPTLPLFAPFPAGPWRDHIVPVEWEACLSTWLALTEAYLSLSESELAVCAAKDESITTFLVSLIKEVAAAGIAILGTSNTAALLLRRVFIFVTRFGNLTSPPPPLLIWEFLSDFSKVYGKKRATGFVDNASQKSEAQTSMQALKKSLIMSLDAGLKGDINTLEGRLKRLHYLIHASPHAASFFLTGSDFLDGLISCYRIMNPPLRKAIITTAYLCLIGLTDGATPTYSMLPDQLYALNAAAEAHKAGPLNANDSMVAELVTVTPILKQVQGRLGQTATGVTRVKLVITALEGHRKPGGNVRPKRLIKRKLDKGKGKMTEEDMAGEIRIHRTSQISQIQDLFPELGSAFVSKLLDQYGDDTEQVVAHLLEDSLPPYVAAMDRGEELSLEQPRRKSYDMAPRSTPPLVPTRHNVFDDDEFDRLAVDVSNIHFGKRNPGRTADDVLKDRSSAPNKAAILSALSAFDADDDERDDTYDAVDSGFIVNDGHPEDANDQKRKDANEEALFKAYQADPKSFERDAATRRSTARAQLKDSTGMTDEAIEGWAVVLARAPQQLRQLEAKHAFSGNQATLASTAWRASPAGSGQEDSDADGGRHPSDRGRGGRGRGRGRGRGGGRGGNSSGPSGDNDTENARKRKEANKGSRANHNRRDQRAKKMSRGGFPG
ncbi:hypothetical protein F5Y16DRAFT_407695 [Xylariaceae sp. FL0255]|nr:hypothetical protein F5Y16DRAFT_407695 [Xylariaceae sp. FL0255]